MAEPAKKPLKLTRPVEREYINPETGEAQRLIHEEPIRRRPPHKARSEGAFGLWFPEGVGQLARMKLSGLEYSVLLQLLEWSDFEDHTGYSATDLANKLEVHPNAISRAARVLRECGVLLPGGGPRRVWINPEYFWRGAQPARRRVIDQLKKSNAATPQTEKE